MEKTKIEHDIAEMERAVSRMEREMSFEEGEPDHDLVEALFTHKDILKSVTRDLVLEVLDCKSALEINANHLLDVFMAGVILAQEQPETSKAVRNAYGSVNLCPCDEHTPEEMAMVSRIAACDVRSILLDIKHWMQEYPIEL